MDLDHEFVVFVDHAFGEAHPALAHVRCLANLHAGLGAEIARTDLMLEHRLAVQNARLRDPAEVVGILRMQSLGALAFVYDARAEEQHVQIVRLHALDQACKRARLDSVVRVEEIQVIAASLLDAAVARRAGAAVLALMHRSHAIDRAGVFVAQARRIVDGAVIHQDDFACAGRKALVLQLLEAGGQVGGRIVHGYDYRQIHRVSPSSSSARSTSRSILPLIRTPHVRVAVRGMRFGRARPSFMQNRLRPA